MTTTLPVTRHSHGRTFVIAMALLGVAGVAQFGSLGWVFYQRSRGAAAMAKADVQSAAAVAAELPNAETKVAKTTDAPQRIDLQQVLAAPTPVASAAPVPILPMELPRPTPVSPAQEPMTPAAQVTETVEQAKALRDRGDTGTALIRLREAQMIAPRNPMVIAELAATYEGMGQTEKALEYWRRVYDMGTRAGIYYTAAAAKVNPAPDTMTTPANAEVAGIQPGMTLGIADISKEELDPAGAARHLILHIPIKARPGTQVDANDVFIQVMFYDRLPDASVTQTTADVKPRWATAPVDWADSSIEMLDVEYSLPKAAKNEGQREYFGYVASVYYRGDLQDWRADPNKLREMAPPPTTQAASEAAASQGTR